MRKDQLYGILKGKSTWISFRLTRLACDCEGVRPDVVILGKALGGGVIPASAVLAYKDIMLCIQPGSHGRSADLGEQLRQLLNDIQQHFPNYVKDVRGRGLFNAIELNNEALASVYTYDLCLKMKERGVLAKPTHDTIICLTPAPPLCKSPEEIRQRSEALHDVLEHDLPQMQKNNPKPDKMSSSEPCDRCGRVIY